MKLPEMISFIEGIETKYPVDEWIIDHIHIWPLLRINLIFSLSIPAYLPILARDNDRGNIVKTIGQIASVLRSISNYSYVHLMDFNKNASLNRKYDLVFLSDGLSYVYLKDAWNEKFCDPLISEFENINRSSLLLTPGRNRFVPRKSASRMVQLYIDYINIKEKIFPSRSNQFVNNMGNYDLFLKLLQSNGQYSSSYSLEKIISRINIIRNCANYFKKIIEKVKPIAGIVVSYYNTQGMAFNLACRECGIPSIHIQHGFQGDSNFAYARWNKLPKHGYELIPSIFLCWSDDDAKAIAEWSDDVSSYHKPIAFGNPAIGYWQSSDNEHVKYYDNVMNSRKLYFNNYAHILYTLSCTTQSEIDMLINIINELNKIGLSCFFWIRLHPTRLTYKKEINKIIKKYNIRNADFRIASKIPLYALLRNIDIHITEFSSTVIEAESFLVPSIITHEFGSQTFRKQIDSGIAVVAYELNDIIAAIRDLTQKKSLIKEINEDRAVSRINIESLLDTILLHDNLS